MEVRTCNALTRCASVRNGVRMLCMHSLYPIYYYPTTTGMGCIRKEDGMYPLSSLPSSLWGRRHTLLRGWCVAH